MKSNHLSLVITLFFLFSCNILFAENPEEKAKNMTDDLKQKLSLTDAQYNSVLEINTSYLREIEELKAENKRSQDSGSREKFKATQDEWNKKIAEVLTEEQFKEYQNMQKNTKRGMKNNNR